MCVKLHVEQAQRSKNVQDSERDFYIRVPRGTEKHQRKKNTGEYSLKPVVNNERRRKGVEQASSSVNKGKRTDWRQTLDKSRGQSCD